MSQTIRSFIAFELPDAVISLLDTVQQELTSLRLRARWVRPANIHLTLKFLGDINVGQIDDIGAAMADAAEDCPPLTLAVDGIGFFPGMRRPRVIWLGLGGQIQALQNLQRNLEDRLATLGFAKEKRSFKAHLTLGRMREAVDPAIIGRAAEQYAELGNPQFTADRMILFRSDLQPSGAVYSQLKQVGLGTLEIG